MSNFKDNHINGANLKELSVKDLEEDLGMKDQSHIKLLLKRLAELYKIMPENNIKHIQKLLESYEPKLQKTGEMTPIIKRRDATKGATILHATERGYLMESIEGKNAIQKLPPASKWEESIDNADNRPKEKKDAKANGEESSSTSSSSSSSSSSLSSEGSEEEKDKKEAAAREEKKKREFLMVSSSNFESRSPEVTLSNSSKSA